MQLPTSGPSPHGGAGGGGPGPVAYQQQQSTMLIGGGIAPMQQHHHGGAPPGMLPPHMLPPDAHPGPMRPMPPPPPGPIPMLESRISEMNRRLHVFSSSGVSDRDYAQWWDAFAHEFFDENAHMSIIFTLEENGPPKRYTIGRTLIPRYFRTIFESGVKEMFYVLRNPSREYFTNVNTAVLECDGMLLVTKHDRPVYSEVQTEARLVCEFFLYDDPSLYPRILHWQLELKTFQEFVLRATGASAGTDPTLQDQLSKNFTRQGMTSPTLNYLRLCVILEPMQHLMSQHKQYNVPPRECLKQTLFQRFHAQQRNALQNPALGGGPGPIPHPMVPPMPEEPPTRPAPKRKRTRKGSQSGGATPTTSSKKKNTVSPAPTASSNFALNSSHVDVMVVGEPSMMGGEYGEEDERMISRLENTQYDASVSHALGPPPSAAAGGGRSRSGAKQRSGIPPPPPMSYNDASWTGALLPRPASSGTSPHTPGTSSRIGTPMIMQQPGSVPASIADHQRTSSTSELAGKSTTPDSGPSSANGGGC